mgnify:FL=1
MLINHLPPDQGEIISKLCFHQILSLKRLMISGLPPEITDELYDMGIEDSNIEAFIILKAKIKNFKRVKKKPHLVFTELDEKNLEMLVYILTRLDTRLSKKYRKESITAIYRKFQIKFNHEPDSEIKHKNLN